MAAITFDVGRKGSLFLGTPAAIGIGFHVLPVRSAASRMTAHIP